MDPIEKALRAMLEKGDAGDRAFRGRVYGSASAALERSLVNRSDLTPAVAQKRRDDLAATIAQVETEFTPAAPAPSVDLSAPAAFKSSADPAHDPHRLDFAAGAPSARSSNAPNVEPAVETGRGAAPELDAPRAVRSERVEAPAFPSLDRTDDPSRDPTADPAAFPAAGTLDEDVTAGRPPRRRGGSVVMAIAALVVLAIIAAGGWWLFAGGAPQSVAGSGTAEGAAPRENTDAGTSVADPAEADGDWITIFTPSDPTRVSAPSGARADVRAEGDRSVVTISSDAPDNAVTFDVGQGVLEQLAGRSAVFRVVAKANQEETQISVSCDFGALGDCGRKRYTIGPTSADYLFEAPLENAAPRSGGTISIVPDITGSGKALDIFAIQASVSR